MDTKVALPSDDSSGGAQWWKQRWVLLLVSLGVTHLLGTLLRPHKHGSKGHPKKKAALEKGFRPDIQGLRALAVLLVVSDHFFGWPAGGFIGVDVFFVLSGFLITGIMLREHKKTGRISFANFYRRRVRRIMPVAVLVLALTVVVSALLFVGERSRSVALDGLWSLFFASNWRFASTGTDYLQAEGPVSPLQHYWSLAVEEQFYVVWPVLLVVLFVFVPQALLLSAHRATALLVAATVTLIVSSLAFAVWETGAAPTVAYFSTFSRAWELGIGALIAIGASRLATLPAHIRPVMQWAGIVGVFLSAFIIGPSSDFPGPAALLPVLSTGLILAGGISATSSPFILSNTVSRYIGDISYSLYLWHFPVIIFLGTVFEPSALGVLIAIATMVLLSVLSFHFVEDPIRRSQWLNGKAKTTQKKRFALEQKHGLGLLALTVAPLIIFLGLIGEREASYSDAAYVAPVPTTISEKAAPGSTRAQRVISTEIQAALAAQTFPDLQPSLDDLGRGGFAREDSGGCGPATPGGKDCSALIEDPEKTAVVLGDSQAVAWLPAIRAVLEPKGWTVASMTYVGCPFIAADTEASGEGIMESCPGHKQIVRDIVSEADPGLIIIGNAYGQQMVDADSEPSLEVWKDADAIAHEEWLSSARRVVTLESTPPGANPAECVTRLGTPRDCVEPIPQVWNDYTRIDRAVVEAAGHTYIPTSSWFCGQGQQCPLFVGSTVVRRDSTHLTADYAQKIAPLLEEALTPALEGAAS